MEIDLSRNGTLSKYHSKQLNDISRDVRHLYNSFVDKLLENNGSDICVWVSRSTCRNTITSNAFETFCKLLFLKKLIQENSDIEAVKVSHYPEYSILRNYFDENSIDIKILCDDKKDPGAAKQLVSVCYTFSRSVVFLLFSFLGAFFSGPRGGIRTDEPVTLIETFVSPSVIKGQTFTDRYFPGLFEYLEASEVSGFYFIPTITGFRNLMDFIRLYRTLRSNHQRFLIREDFLKLSDYLFALRRCLLKLPRLGKPWYFEGFNVTPLIEAEINDDRGSKSRVEALLKYRLPARLQEKGMDVKLVVDWFENQVIDRGQIKGFCKAFPDAKIIGYQGFLQSNNYLCQYPTTFEQINDSLPDEIVVMGKALLEPVKEFCPNIKVTVGPSFRFSGVWRERTANPDLRFITVLIALPVAKHLVEAILKLIPGTSKMDFGREIRFWIKPHPFTDRRVMEEVLDFNSLQGVEMVKENFNDIIQRANLLISSGSSACLESLAMGIPVAVIGSLTGISFNPIPDTVDNKMWRLCYDSDELTESISHFSQEDIQAYCLKKAPVIRRDYFQPVTKDGVRKMLDLN